MYLWTAFCASLFDIFYLILFFHFRGCGYIYIYPTFDLGLGSLPFFILILGTWYLVFVLCFILWNLESRILDLSFSHISTLNAHSQSCIALRSHSLVFEFCHFFGLLLWTLLLSLLTLLNSSISSLRSSVSLRSTVSSLHFFVSPRLTISFSLASFRVSTFDDYYSHHEFDYDDAYAMFVWCWCCYPRYWCQRCLGYGSNYHFGK